MISTQEYSILAAAVYNDARGKPNQLDLSATGWALIDSTSDTTHQALSSGLSMNAYEKDGQIVIACKGTDFLIGTNDGQTAADLLADGGLGLGLGSSQIFQAALFYEKVKAAHPGVDITFTGHSLGAGLASILSVWFNRPATIFADAPFESTATSMVIVGGVIAALAANGYTDSDLSTYAASLGMLFSSRESLVTSYYVEGEVLNKWLSALPFVVGTNKEIQIEDAENISSLTLHSIVLHSSLLISETLRTDTFALPSLVARIFDAKLYATKLESQAPDFLTKLLTSQISQPNGVTSAGKLTGFADDMAKLGTDAAGLNTAAQNAIIAQGIEWYFWQGQNYTGQQFFTQSGDILQYTSAEGAQFTGAQDKADTYVKDWLAGYFGADGPLPATSYDQWNVVTNGVDGTAGALDAEKTQIFLGEKGDDHFMGGSLDDLLLGADGDDTLDGGAGSDSLYGGAGMDTYSFDGNWGSDLVVDSDGVGSVEVDGARLSGGAKAADGYYIGRDSAGNEFDYTLVGNGDGGTDLAISASTGTSRIMVRDWHQGDLGITLAGDYVDPNPPPTRITVTGLTDGDDDYTHGTETRDQLIDGGTGNDALAGARGADSILGGTGSDLITGSSGQDTIQGGDGGDFIFGSVYQFFTASDDSPPASYGQELARGRGWVAYIGTGSGNNTLYLTGANDQAVYSQTTFYDYGKLIDGGAGNDYIFSGTGDDLVHGGADNDQINGLAGSDTLFGDDGNDIIAGDGLVHDAGIDDAAELSEHTPLFTPASFHGDDLLDGGAGNDTLEGQGGSDSLYGGIGDDQLIGDATNDMANRAPPEIHGDDYLDGGDGRDQLIGGGGDDDLFGGADDDKLYGDDATNKLDGSYHGRDYLDGEDGADYMEGQGNADTLFGGSGDDTMWGDAGVAGLSDAQNGNDYLDGEDGNDLIAGGGGDDELYGGDGSDSLSGDATEDIVAGSAHGDDYLDGEGGDDNLQGDGGADTLYGGDGNDSLVGDAAALDGRYHGDDFLSGELGNDTLIGGGGADQLDGGDGDDYLDGDSLEVATEYQGADTLDGGAGADTMLGGGGDDFLDGGAGKDQMEGETGNDLMSGGDDDDIMLGNDGDDFIDGGAGNDQLLGGAGTDSLDGGDGNDLLQGESGNDLLQGGAGDDDLYGGDGDDTLNGGAGQDYVDGGQGNDTYVFDAEAFDGVEAGVMQQIVDDDGDNTLRFDYAPGSTLSVEAGLNGGDLIVEYGGNPVYITNGLLQSTISRVITGDGKVWTREDLIDMLPATHVIGRDVNDDILGGAAADTLAGGAGNDTLDGSGGNDVLTGGIGNDVYRFGRGDGADTIDNGASDHDTSGDTLAFKDGVGTGDLTLKQLGDDLLIDAGNGDQVTVSGWFTDPGKQIEHMQFADGTVWDQAAIAQHITAPGGGDTLPGGGTGTNASGSDANDTMTGTDGQDTLHGLGGNDSLAGLGGADALYGDAGYDTLNGGAGNDTLDGGAGDDSLYGGAGSDTYVLGDVREADKIYETGGDASDVDTLVMGPGVRPADIIAYHSGDSLQLHVAGNTQGVWLMGQFAARDARNQIERVLFDDGTVWTAAMLEQMVLATSDADETIIGCGFDDAIDAQGGNDVVYGLGGNDSLQGGAGNDSLDGSDGNDTLDGGTGNDTLNGGAGADLYLFGRGQGADTIIESGTADSATDVLRLGAGIVPSDVALYQAGNDLVLVLNGSNQQVWIRSWFATTQSGQPAGYQIERFEFADGTAWDSATIAQNIHPQGSADVFTGTSGNDTYVVDNPGDTVTEGANQGTDTIKSSVSYGLPANVENLTLTGTLNINASGNDLANVLTGNSGDNTLSTQGSALDTLVGGAGDDTYVLYNGSGVVTEAADGGNDTVIVYHAGQEYDLPDNVENLSFSSDYIYNAYGYGNASDNVIWTDPLRLTDWYDGKGGVDTIVSRSGGGYFVVDNPGDRIVLASGVANRGIYVFAKGDYTLPSSSNYLTMMGGDGARGTGTDGNDTLNGSYAMDPLHVLPNLGSATVGNYGIGAQELAGGKGNDTYVLGYGDTIEENAGEGIDTAYVDWELGQYDPAVFDMSTMPNLENVDLKLVSTAFSVIGNAADNLLSGNAGGNALRGGAGNDRLVGLAGNDTLDGGNGADTMQGDAGDDTFYVDDAGDQVIDASGVDTVVSSVDYTLGSSIENLSLTGTAGVSGTGNALDNVLDGSANGGANLLTGGLGNDTYRFGAGAGADRIDNSATDNASTTDTLALDGTSQSAASLERVNDDLVLRLASGDSMTVLGYFDASADRKIDRIRFADGFWDQAYIAANTRAVITGTDGDDALSGTAGADAIHGGAGNDSLTGLDGNDTLVGEAGNDLLDGGAGQDVLIGGTGDDTYVLDDVGDQVVEAAGEGTDTILASGWATLPDNVENGGVIGDANTSLVGNALANTLTGGAGDDWLSGGAGADTYVFKPGFGHDTVDDSTTADGEIDTIRMTGIQPAQVSVTHSRVGLVLSVGADSLTLWNWFDDPAAQAKRVVFDDGSVWDAAGLNGRIVVAPGTDGDDVMFGTDVGDLLDAKDGADSLYGYGGADTLIGGAGDDYMEGGEGADTYVFDPSFGFDTVWDEAPPGEVDTLLLHGVTPDQVTVARDPDWLYLVVKNAPDRVALTDWYDDDAATNKRVVFDDGTVWDAATLASMVTLADATPYVDNLYGGSGGDTLDAGDGDDWLYGNLGNDMLSGGNGDDWLEGDAGNDTVNGGTGSNTYWFAVGDGQDILIDAWEGGARPRIQFDNGIAASEVRVTKSGNDLVLGYGAGDSITVTGYFLAQPDLEVGFQNDASWTPVDIEARLPLSITGTAGADNLTGTAADEELDGLAGNDTLAGGDGNDTLDGGAGNDQLKGGNGDDVYIVDSTSDVVTENSGAGTDTVQSSVTWTLGSNLENLVLTGSAAINGTGNSAANVLTGNGAANTLSGGSGADTMIGGAGDDIYVVDNAGDLVVENAAEGMDSVQASVSFTLGANIENLTLTGSSALSGTGNEANNLLQGNSAANLLDGGAGNDTLNGGSGKDTMKGGLGDDTFVVDNTGDVVTENANEGSDLVQSSVSYTLSSNVENLSLTGSSTLSGTGNALDNALTGNSAANTLTGAAGNDTLDGGAGADKLVGGTGDDTYVVDNSSDTVTENAGEGTDSVLSSITYTLPTNVEAVTLTGSSAINATGNSADNLLIGNGANNTVSGGSGNDLMQGGAGADTISDTSGKNLFDGGAGNDSMTGGTGAELFAGGAGNDTITTSTGQDVILFNRGDGMDTVASSTTKDNTVSLGNGIRYADLQFKKSSSDLILVTGTNEQITFKDWYLSSSNHSIANLQLIIANTADYDPTGAATQNRKVETFDFDGLAGAFDAARSADSSLTSWSLSASLAQFYLSGSDSAAIGGDLSYQYGTTGTLSGIGMAAAESILASSQFGVSAQALQGQASLSGPARLS